MKSLVKAKPEVGLWMQERSIPEIGPEDVLIKVKKTGICGTDIHIWNWDDWAAHPSIKQGNGVNKIRVVMKGDSLAYFVNNQQIFQKTDKTFAGGDVGVFALTLIDAPGTDISFDNVSVVKGE